MRVVFEVVSLSQRKTGKCAICGKPAVRSIKVEYTINPYNRNADGMPKTREEVRADVRAELDRRLAEPLKHAKCQ